jgi:hypothetical protein
MKFDFNYWSNLQKSNPDEFEKQRKKFIDDNVIEMSKNEIHLWKLRGIQVRIMIEIDKYKDPVARMVQSSYMMNNWIMKHYSL